MPGEMSYRYSKLYPTEGKDCKKYTNNSPKVEENVRISSFSDYFRDKNKKNEVKDFGEIVEEEANEEVEENPFKKATIKLRSSSISYSNSQIEKMKLQLGSGNMQIKNQEGFVKNERPNFMQTVRTRKVEKLKDEKSPRQNKLKPNQIIQKSKRMKTVKKIEAKNSSKLKKTTGASKLLSNKTRLKNPTKISEKAKEIISSPKFRKKSPKNKMKLVMRSVEGPSKLM